MGLIWKLKQCDLLFVLVLVIATTSEPLTGENVCHRMENYTATWTETYEEYVPVFTTTWCMSMPPKCLKTHQELRIREKNKTEVRQRNVTVCCDGYTQQKLSIDDKNNSIIKCGAVSQCKPGFIGKNCDKVCPQGTWGVLCTEACNCSNHFCNPITGSCQCPPGWIGNKCLDKCKVGKWGPGCELNCSCLDKNKICHHETGNCTEIIESIDKLSEINNGMIAKIFTDLSTTITSLSNEKLNDNLINTIPTKKSKINDEPKDFFIDTTTKSKNIGGNEVSVTTSRNEIVLNSSLATTIINKYQEHTTSSDVRVIKVSKSTTRPILALVHMSSKTVTGHEKMIVTPITEDNNSVNTLPLSLEIVAIIVIGSIMSLGLTTMVVLALLHIRTKLFETIRMSIYNNEKLDNHGSILTNQKFNDEIKFQSLGRNSKILCQPSDYETPKCIIPNRSLTLPRTISTINTLTRESTYSNQFPNIQLFNSPQELLEAHYDRPPATKTFRQFYVPGCTEGEHLYDEIPLQSTMLKKFHDTLQ